MTEYGIHCSHEQIPPARLLEAVIAAERAGFDAAMCSDHFSPWSERQGESGFAWAWLGAALQATNLSFGVVNAPGQRYHPAIIAQAIGTLGAMFPGRFWAALGSGEFSNEHITGGDWPRKDVREARLLESVDVIRDLLAGEMVSRDGLITVDRAKLYTRPETPPPLIGAAVSTATAKWVAGWADGLVTTNGPEEHLREMIAAYRGNGGRGPICLQVHLSWAGSEEEAERIAHDQWRSNIFPPPVCWDLGLVEHFDVVSEAVTVDQVRKVVNISADLEQHIEWLRGYAALGFDRIYLHHVGQDLMPFIETFGSKVLPALR